jgi:uncharacterized protein (DUF849 family)
MGGRTDVAAGKRKVIITCVVTGAPQAPSMSPRPAATPEEIAEQAIEAARAGAAILLLPTLAQSEGWPTRDRAINGLASRIAAETDAIIGLAARGDSSLAALPTLQPELWTLSLSPPTLPSPAEKIGTARVDDALRDLRSILARFAGAPRTRVSFECRDVDDLHAIKRLADEELVKGPLFLQYGLGTGRWGTAEPESLAQLRATADGLFGRENHEFSVFGNGRQQMSVVTVGAIMGGHVRVGLEDFPHLPRGPSTMTCSAQVLKIRRILGELSLPIASPAEAREILQIEARARAGSDG